MKITAIKQQQKYQNRYSVYIDAEYVCSVSANDLIEFGLHQDQELTQAQIKELQQAAELSLGYERALGYLSYRPRSQFEIEDYLKRKGYSQAAIEQISAKLRRQGLIDDLEFAKAWVASRQALKPRSKRHLIQELRQKRVSDDLIESALAEVSDDDQLSALKHLIRKKRHRYDDERKLIAYLSRQGYSYDLIKKALED